MEEGSKTHEDRELEGGKDGHSVWGTRPSSGTQIEHRGAAIRVLVECGAWSWALGRREDAGGEGVEAEMEAVFPRD